MIELAEKGYKTKRRVLKNRSVQGDRWIDKSSLYKIFNNCTYVGEVEHKGVIYPGAHEAIISSKLWDQVHRILKDNSRYRADQGRSLNVSDILL